MKAFITFKTKEERRLELKGINVEVTLRATLTFAAHLLGRALVQLLLEGLDPRQTGTPFPL